MIKNEQQNEQPEQRLPPAEAAEKAQKEYESMLARFAKMKTDPVSMRSHRWVHEYDTLSTVLKYMPSIVGMYQRKAKESRES